MTAEFIHRDNELEIRVKFDITREVANWTGDAFESVVKSAIVDELAKSPEFQELLRKLVLQRLIELLDYKK